MTSRRAVQGLAVAIMMLPWITGCGGDKNNNPPHDVPTDGLPDADPDAVDDVPAEVPTDTTEETPVSWRTCARSCTTSDGCCLTGGRPCGEYPNKWTCDAVCMSSGCASDTECVTWATALSLPGAANYKCKTAHLYYTAGFCVPGCTTADDCCPSGTDCSTYPQRRLCEDGGCSIDGCTSTGECQTWAARAGLPDPSDYVCATFGYSDTATCARPCASVADCCPSGSCGTFPNHVDCIAGHCLATCTEDGECRDWAVSNGYPGAGDYVCHTFP